MIEQVYEEAIAKVMKFYNQSRENVIQYYWDEVESMIKLISIGVCEK